MLLRSRKSSTLMSWCMESPRYGADICYLFSGLMEAYFLCENTLQNNKYLKVFFFANSEE